MVNDADSVRWMVFFCHSEGRDKDEQDFPKVDLWYPNREASIEAGTRVLEQLKERGDDRDWRAVGFPDPFRVASGHYSGGLWVIPS